MRLKNFFIFLFSGLTVFQGCKSKSGDEATISGTFTNLPGTKLFVYQLLPSSKPLVDSIVTDAAGNFNISVPVKNEGYFIIQGNPGDEITLVTKPGENIIIHADAKALSKTYSVQGSKDSKLYAEYLKFTNTNLSRVDSLSQVFAEKSNNPGFSQLKQLLDSAYLEIYNHQKEQVISFVNTHLNSLASLLVISEDFGPNPLLSEKTQPDLFFRLDSALFHTYPENSFVNTFHLRMLTVKAEIEDTKAHEKILEPGMQAPEIVLPNAAGKEVKLSSMQGKLTLVYFWSSWNALCRQVNMNLTPIYSRFHDRGFEIYAVSIDSDADLWKKACLIDKAYWNQVIDTRGLKSEYCKIYVVRAIPKMMLIAKDGKIIARDPQFNELEDLIRKNM